MSNVQNMITLSVYVIPALAGTSDGQCHIPENIKHPLGFPHPFRTVLLSLKRRGSASPACWSATASPVLATAEDGKAEVNR